MAKLLQKGHGIWTNCASGFQGNRKKEIPPSRCKYFFTFSSAVYAVTSPGTLPPMWLASVYMWSPRPGTNLPSDHGIIVTPSGRFPSAPCNPDGSWWESKALCWHQQGTKIMLLSELYGTVHPWLEVQDKPWYRSWPNSFPQNAQPWGWQIAAPTLRTIAILTVSLDIHKPRDEMGGAFISFFDWLEQATKSQALDSSSLQLSKSDRVIMKHQINPWLVPSLLLIVRTASEMKRIFRETRMPHR